MITQYRLLRIGRSRTLKAMALDVKSNVNMMAFLQQSDTVRYACTCGALKPISRIYFCRHCLRIRCGFCVCHEVDSNYCSHCLENLPSSEARLKKQRCASCFDCPVCMNRLTTRSTTQNVPNPEDPSKPETRKGYYLCCGLCRWTTRDAGLADLTVATGGWQEKVSLYTPRILALVEFYKTVARLEKHDKEKKKHTSRSYLTLGSSALIRKRVGLGPASLDSQNLPPLEKATACEEVEQLPDNIFTSTVNLNEITTLKQRLAQPEFQPVHTSQLYPLQKPLLIKRSQRCRSCDHNVSKPEYNPQSIKFKIQLSSFYHVPEVRMITCEPLKVGHTSQLIIKICNPTQHQSSIEFLPLPDPVKELEEFIREAEEIAAMQKEAEKQSYSLPSSLTRQMSSAEDPRLVQVLLSGDLDLPRCCVILPPRDDAAEYDDSGDTHNFGDDPKVVAWRKANKVAVRLSVTPNEKCSQTEGKVVAGFLMQYSYVNTMATLEQKEPQKVLLKVKIYVTAGKVAATA